MNRQPTSRPRSDRPRRARHVVLTRFNVAHDELEGNGARGLDRDWLEHRLGWFDSLCAPSIRSQSRRRFDWLVFVHPDTPSDLRTRIELLVQHAGGQVVLRPSATPRDAATAIADLASPCSSDLLITTRLDNDDALSFDFVERVQAACTSPPPLVVNPLLGCQIDDLGVVRLATHRSSPFISYVESAPEGDAPRTVWGFRHRYPPPGANVVQLRGLPMWLAAVHGRNIANPKRAGVNIPRAVTLARFQISPSILADPTLATVTSRSIIEALAVARRRASGRLRSGRREDGTPTHGGP